MTLVRPGGEISKRELHFIWIVDCSGSMDGEKIRSLNQAIHEALPQMRQVADENPFAQILIRVIKFSTGAQWQIPTPTPVHEFKWTDLSAYGTTSLGEALRLAAQQLTMPPMPERALPPVLVLVSDGQPTDNFEKGLKELLALPWGRKAVRVAIAIGRDCDREVLKRFIDNVEIEPLEANNPEALARSIRWVSTKVVQAASSPPSQASSSTSKQNVPIQVPTDLTNAASVSAADVW